MLITCDFERVRVPENRHASIKESRNSRTTRTFFDRFLQTRIDLQWDVCLGPLVVVDAGLLDRLWEWALELVWLLNDVDVQTLGHVPGDVAMEWPDTWIVLLVLDDGVGWLVGDNGTEWWDTEGVTDDSAGWVTLDDAIPGDRTSGEDIEVVTVQMHGVSLRPEVAHDETDGWLVDWEGVDVPLLLVCPVSAHNIVVQVHVHVGTERLIVYGPDEVGSIIHEVEIEVNGLKVVIKRNRAESLGSGQSVVTASTLLRDGEATSVWRNRVLISALVVYGSDSLGGDTIGERATILGWGVTHLSAHPVAGTWGTGGLDNDVRSLTDSKVDERSAVWHNWLEIVGDDRHVVAINLVLDESISRWVDETNAVGLARLESELGNTCIWRALESGVAAWEVVLAVDQDVVGQRSGAVHGLSEHGVVILVVMIRQHDWSYILIIADVRWAVDDNWTESTASILSAVVRVVPGRTELVGTEAVSKTLLRSDWALLDRWNTVPERSLVHKQAVPVKSGWLAVVARLLWQIVLDVDLDPVTPVSLDERTWELAVDEDTVLLDSVWGDLAICNTEVVLASDASVWHGSADSCRAVGSAAIREWWQAAGDGADPAARGLAG